ncbi:PoNe immunity protein domain-containing protein [Flavobacterium enshiense]|uniref:PoNe immunity protein domain-containing protein n=1 Tax=Flavobacterium enshiense TaxID=1341165 RepID=UPI00345D5971
MFLWNKKIKLLIYHFSILELSVGNKISDKLASKKLTKNNNINLAKTIEDFDKDPTGMSKSLPLHKGSYPEWDDFTKNIIKEYTDRLIKNYGKLESPPIHIEKVKISMRDTYKNTAYFEENIKDYNSSISQYKQKLIIGDFSKVRTPIDEYVRRLNYSMFLDALNLLKCQYSVGSSISEIKTTYLEALDYMQNGWKKTEKDFDGYYVVDDYWDVLSMLSLGYILNIDQEKLERLIKLRFVVNKPDFLLDTLCNAIQNESVPKGFDIMKYGNKYSSLYDIIHTQNKEEATKLLFKYVKSDWYKKTQANSWHGRHNSHSYDGYWSFESAALVKLLGLDDSTFKDLKYYPYDLLHGV